MAQDSADKKPPENTSIADQRIEKTNVVELLPSTQMIDTLEKASAQGIAAKYDAETRKMVEIFQTEKSPAVAFREVVAERTRADNLLCGINGEGMHQATEDFFSQLLELPNLTPDQILVYSRVRDESRILKKSRALIRKLLVVDAATDPTLYDKGISFIYDVPTLGLDQSRTARHVDENLTRQFASVVDEITAQRDLWLTTVSQQEIIYDRCVPDEIRKPINEEIFGSSGIKMKQAIENLGNIRQRPEELTEAFKDSSEDKYQKAIFGTVDEATLAQGHLEHMHYFADLMLLQALEKNNGVLTEEQRKAVKGSKE